MLTRRNIVLGGLSLAVAGCVTLPPIKYSPAEVRSWRYTGTRVTAATGASITWHGTDTAFATSKGIEQVIATPDPSGSSTASQAQADYAEKVRKLVTTEPTRSEYQRFIVSQASAPLSSAMGQRLSSELVGGRDVRVEIQIKSIVIQHSVLRVLVDLIQSIQVELAVVDAKTGEKLAVYPEITSILQKRGGVTGILVDAALARSDIETLSLLTANQTRNWLLNR
jgi:hypothetical protein